MKMFIQSNQYGQLREADIKVGDRVRYEKWEGCQSTQRVTEVCEDIKNGQPGLCLEENWCYADQVVGHFVRHSRIAKKTV